MSNEQESWSCTKCSFLNHPELMFCEMCEGERVMINFDVPIHQEENNLVVTTSKSNDDKSWSIEKATFQMDDCSCTSGIMELLKTMLVKERNSFGASWSCGYRNVQMISSALMQIPAYREKLYSGKGRMPNINIIQQWIEEAWKDGFDIEGCSHYGGKLIGTKEWIGTTECCALLRYFGVRARIVDFHPQNYENRKRKLDHASGDEPESNEGSDSGAESQIQKHIGIWLKQYFHGINSSNCVNSCSSNSSGTSLFFKTCAPSSESTSTNKFLPPLYFQHDGHSRTIVGITVENDVVDALVLDPACSGQLIVKNLKECIESVRGAKKWQRQLRKPMERFKKSEYQILYVESEGLMISKEEREQSKIIESISFSNQFY